MPSLATREKKAIARPLKVLVPLIKQQLLDADAAGLEHYRRAGEMLLEAKDQVTRGAWGRWLTRNFELGKTAAYRYMRLAQIAENRGRDFSPQGESLKDAIGEDTEKRTRSAWRPLFTATRQVNVAALAQERQTHEEEVRVRRTLALQLIDLGYRALATRLHPDRGGSKDAMVRLNLIRDELKDVAATRRFL